MGLGWSFSRAQVLLGALLVTTGGRQAPVRLRQASGASTAAPRWWVLAEPISSPYPVEGPPGFLGISPPSEARLGGEGFQAEREEEGDPRRGKQADLWGSGSGQPRNRLGPELEKAQWFLLSLHDALTQCQAQRARELGLVLLDVHPEPPWLGPRRPAQRTG